MFEKIKRVVKNIVYSTKLRTKLLFGYDYELFSKYSGALNLIGRGARISQIIMAFHVIEKGLTMPRRRLNFGHDALTHLIELIDTFEKDIGEDCMVEHAAGVVKEYYELHRKSNVDFEQDVDFWKTVEDFCVRHQSIPATKQFHFTKKDFFSRNQLPFPEFAASRHSCRHFQGKIDLNAIKAAVSLAMTAPSACDRQYTKVHVITNCALKDKVLSMQYGNRGFGCDADKVILVTTDLCGVRWIEERNDPFVNAGIFIMNLSYALHYHEVAHCILNWSVGRYADKDMHDLLDIPMNERIVAIIACGGMPEEVDVASSPRKPIEQVLVIHDK